VFLHHPLKTAEGIACEHHRLSALAVSHDWAELAITLESWPDEAARLEGSRPVGRWNVGAAVALLDLSAGLPAGVLQAVLATDPFRGATPLADAAGGVDALRDRKAAELRAARDAAEAAGIEWGGGRLAGDVPTRLRLLGAALARAAPPALLGDKPDPEAASAAMAAHVERTHATLATLLADVAAADPAAIDSIRWPAGAG
jgi:hypothetical protein